MVKKIKKYAKFVVCVALIMGLIAPSYAALSASDGSAFVTKAEFDSALADFNARLTTFEAGINSKIDSQVTSYLDRNGIWNGKDQMSSIKYANNSWVFLNRKPVTLKVNMCNIMNSDAKAKLTKADLSEFNKEREYSTVSQWLPVEFWKTIQSDSSYWTNSDFFNIWDKTKTVSKSGLLCINHAFQAVGPEDKIVMCYGAGYNGSDWVTNLGEDIVITASSGNTIVKNIVDATVTSADNKLAVVKWADVTGQYSYSGDTTGGDTKYSLMGGLMLPSGDKNALLYYSYGASDYPYKTNDEYSPGRSGRYTIIPKPFVSKSWETTDFMFVSKGDTLTWGINPYVIGTWGHGNYCFVFQASGTDAVLAHGVGHVGNYMVKSMSVY